MRNSEEVGRHCCIHFAVLLFEEVGSTGSEHCSTYIHANLNHTYQLERGPDPILAASLWKPPKKLSTAHRAVGTKVTKFRSNR